MLHIVSISRDPASAKTDNANQPAQAGLDAALQGDAPEVFALELDLVLHGEPHAEAHGEAVADAMPPTTEPAETPQELDAELWLASLQDQSEVQLAARDFKQPQTPEQAAAQKDPALQTMAGRNNNAITSAITNATTHAAPANPAQLSQHPAQNNHAPAGQTINAELQAAALAGATTPVAVETTVTETAAPANPPAREASLQSTLKLPEAESRWGEKMLQALRETVELQIQGRTQNATIRLDPPELGSLEIFLSHEKGRLSVQITSSQVDVARLLQQTSERLRLDLASPNLSQVSVEIFSEGQGGQRHSQQRSAWLSAEDPIIAGNAEQAQSQVQSEQDRGAQRSDILVTV